MSGWAWLGVVVVVVLAAVAVACSMVSSQCDQAQERHNQ